jgi:hypothetical protein
VNRKKNFCPRETDRLVEEGVIFVYEKSCCYNVMEQLFFNIEFLGSKTVAEE